MIAIIITTVRKNEIQYKNSPENPPRNHPRTATKGGWKEIWIVFQSVSSILPTELRRSNPRNIFIIVSMKKIADKPLLGRHADFLLLLPSDRPRSWLPRSVTRLVTQETYIDVSRYESLPCSRGVDRSAMYYIVLSLKKKMCLQISFPKLSSFYEEFS